VTDATAEDGWLTAEGVADALGLTSKRGAQNVMNRAHILPRKQYIEGDRCGYTRYLYPREDVEELARQRNAAKPTSAFDDRPRCARCGIVLEEAQRMPGVLSDVGEGLCGLCRRGWCQQTRS